MKNMSWKTKLVGGLLLFLPLYFATAALGTKFGIWGWQTGLGTLVIGGGPIVLGIVAIVSLVLLTTSWKLSITEESMSASPSPPPEVAEFRSLMTISASSGVMKLSPLTSRKGGGAGKFPTEPSPSFVFR